MDKRLIVIVALAFLLGLGCAAYAEVQNVKVGGDLQIQGVARNNFDLTSGSAGDKEDDQASYMLSAVRVRVDADLTDNVSTTVRLLNERNWTEEDAQSTDIDLDLAYVTLKEFLYAPLTLTLGRQELKFGNGLIVGDPDTNNTVVGLANNVPGDLTLRKAFDAVRATLNYDPLVIDAIYAKINERTTTRNDDTNLYGLNAHYAIDAKNGLDVYYFGKKDGSTNAADPTRVNTLGALLSSNQIDNLTATLEYAYQFGEREPDPNNSGKKIRAWALQASLIYAMPDVAMSPSLGLVYTYLSGDKKTADNKYRNWDPMFEDQTLNSIPNAIFANSNCSVINILGTAKPKEDLTLKLVYGYYRLAQKITGFTNAATNDTYVLNAKKSLGNALDLTATYDYTEDVQLGLTLGWFAPGKAFQKANRRDATQVIGSMKVSF